VKEESETATGNHFQTPERTIFRAETQPAHPIAEFNSEGLWTVEEVTDLQVLAVGGSAP
jgi:hypothetical protein